jgi:V/A-type H+-transporting ATPase subunit E
MNLSELTDKIYAEGVEKGNVEAKQIVENATKKAEEIIAQAEKKAASIIADAESKSADLDKKTRAELKLYAEQSVNAVKTEIVNLLSDKIAADSVKAATADAKFMQGLIAKLAEQLSKNGEVIIEAKDADALKKYFAANAKGLLEKGVKIAEVKGIKTDFTIQPAKGGYKLAFGDAEFIAYFKEMLRPQLVEELF